MAVALDLRSVRPRRWAFSLGGSPSHSPQLPTHVASILVGIDGDRPISGVRSTRRGMSPFASRVVAREAADSHPLQRKAVVTIVVLVGLASAYRHVLGRDVAGHFAHLADYRPLLATFWFKP